ncbi:excinuclease ABC subunit A [Maricaulis maris]|uniref:excinuclease ABC subunit A n=1 Tax=Maricaulis maris TaxID=74318 RepID=UPI003B8E83DB
MFRFKLLAWVLIAFGLVVALASSPMLDAPLELMADLVFWPVDGGPHVTTPAERLLAGISGGLMLGWGVTVMVLAGGGAMPTAMLRGGVAWFVVDSIGSAVAGAPLNIALNTGFLALFLYAGWPRRAA